VAVSVDEVTQADTKIPRPDHPLLQSNGTVDPIWYRFLSNLSSSNNQIKELANAIKTEVDAQHP